MALFAQTKIDASASEGFLAALKNGLSANGAGSGLFASLLSETSESLPQIKPNDPLPSAAKTEVKDTDQGQDKTQEEPQETKVETSRPEAASTEKTALRKTEDRPVQEKPVSREETDEKQEAAAEEDSAQEPLDAEALPLDETTAIKTEKSEKKTKVEEEEELLALLAALAPFEDSAPVQEVAKSEDAQTTKAAEEENPEQMTTEAMLALLAQQRKTAANETGERTEKIKEKKSSQTDNEAASVKTRSSADAEEVLSPALEETAVLPEEAETSLEPSLMQDESVENSGKESWSQLWSRGAKTQGTEQTAQPKENGLAARFQETPAPANGNAPALTIAQTLSGQASSPQNSAASTTSAQVESAAAMDGKTASQPAGLGGGLRSAGSYDFASQLSATRVARGGSAGLPQAIEQLAVQLHKTVKQGQNEMTIQLRPAELGKVEIKLTFLEDNKVQGTVTADKASTLSLLQKDADVLQRALQDAGLQADPGCLDFSLRGESGKESAFTDFSKSGKDGEASLSEIGLEEEAALADESEAEIYYLTPGRVNLRV